MTNPADRQPRSAGHHEINLAEIDAKEEYEITFDKRGSFDIVAERLYQSLSASVREAIGNSVTAVQDAVDMGALDSLEDGLITFELIEEESTHKLVIRDNGIGVTEQKRQELSTVGVTGAGDVNPERIGKFGMGFFALWLILDNEDGLFMMHTNPRHEDEERVSGIWTRDTFIIPEKDLHGGFAPDEYGTEFELYLKPEVSADDIKDWIETFSNRTRVPVVVRERTHSGVNEEEYPPKSILDKYEEIENGENPQNYYQASSSIHNTNGIQESESLEYVVIENEYFRAVNSNLTNRTEVICIDIPVNTPTSNWKGIFDSYNCIEIRLKVETPVVVDGPNEGKFIVKPSDADGEKFVTEKQLTDNDVVLPAPTATRDTLRLRDSFVEWLQERFYENHYSSRTVIQQTDTFEDFMQLSRDEKEEFRQSIKEVAGNLSTYHRLSMSQVKQRLCTDFEREFEEKIKQLFIERVSVAPEGHEGVSRKSNRKDKRLYVILHEAHENNAEVLVGSRISQEKAEFAWDAERDHIVCRTGKPNKLVNKFGCRHLRTLDFETDLRMDEETRNEYLSDSKTEEKLTVHIDSYSRTLKRTVSTLKEELESDEQLEIDGISVRKLILFRRGNTSVSKNRGLVSENIATASVSEEGYEELKHFDVVISGEEALDREVYVRDSDGNEINVVERDYNDLPNYYVYHIIPDEHIDIFRRPTVMDEIQKLLSSELSEHSSHDLVYIPLSEFENQYAGFTDDGWRDKKVSVERYSSTGQRYAVPSLTALYARAVLGDSEKEEALKDVSIKLENGGRELVETIQKVND